MAGGPRLAARTLELVDIASVSRDEAAIAVRVAAVMAETPLELVHAGDENRTLLYATAREPALPLLLLAGHLDTVPGQQNLPGRIEDGAVHGLGASDMKGGLAVMIELARWLGESAPARALDVAFLFFPREELPPEESALPAFFAARTIASSADLVVVLEPTDNTIQAGCLGNLNARIVFHGVSGHSARPWTAENAIDRALEGLRPFAAIEPRPVEIGGLTFTEVASITAIDGGIATNVIPDRVVANVNFRYAPDRSPASADAYLRSLVPEGAHYEHAGDSPPARVVTDSPLVQRLRAAGNLALEPKQAWTNVADFTSRGIDAVNFGPGATRYAHQRDEQVEIASLERCFRSLWAFLTGTV